MKTPNQSDKHTPGPWTWQRMPHTFRLLSAKGKETGLAVKILEAQDEVWPNSANARLIAAAPDMLAALVMAQGFLAEIARVDFGGVSELLAVEAAIAKADGIK